MIANKPPCFKCEDRHENCHSNCESYKKYKNLREELLKKKRDLILIDGYCIERCQTVREKMRRN